MSKSKKIILLVLGLLIVVLSFTGASYAMWQINNSQDGENVVNVGCFETSTDLGTSNENPSINLDKHFPISDDEGMNLTPFTFTISNTCTTVATYQLNLETLSSSNIGKQYIKVAVNNNISNLNTLTSVEKTLSSATSSNMLESGTLYPGQSITFNIRLWLDEATTVEDLGADEPGTNLVYAAKVTLATSARMDNNTAVDTIMKLVAGSSNNTLDVIEKPVPDGAICTNTFGYDNTTDNNLRYIGKNPCNYVYFNCSTANPSEMNSSTCEVWRIIGIMNNVDDGTGKKETRLKLIRKDSLGYYSWDSSTSSASATTDDPAVNNGYGINQWGPSTNYTTNTAYPGAALMQELNGDYLDLTLTANTTWYKGSNNSKEAIFDYTKRLKESAQNMIGNAVWYTGAYNDSLIGNSDVITEVAYQSEKNNNPHQLYHGKYCTTGNYCNDSIERTFTWTGKVGLVYPSDMGYSTSGGTKAEYTREKCVNEVTFSSDGYGSSTNGNCGFNSWLKDTGGWSISPYAHDSYAYYVGYINGDGKIKNRSTNGDSSVLPSVYLNSSVKITSGSGTIDSPYTLSN